MEYAPCEELKLAIQHGEIHILPNQEHKVQLCLHGGCLQVICVLCNAAENVCLWRSQDREMGGIFGRDKDLQQLLMKGVEGTSGGAGVAIQSPRGCPAS